MILTMNVFANSEWNCLYFLGMFLILQDFLLTVNGSVCSPLPPFPVLSHVSVVLLPHLVLASTPVLKVCTHIHTLTS